ncbi:MAG TPA: four helix bundle protein [Parafilimonas sp.]|nr:four helix bundle protein [Parafilimonas sp.]
MFLQLAHTKLEVFQVSKKFVLECYKQTKFFPVDERYAMVQQIRRAALSVHLNVAEGCSRKSEAERKRFFEMSRGSLIEIDAAVDIAVDLNYCCIENLKVFGFLIIETFEQLSALINHNHI